MTDQATEPTTPLVAVQDKRALFATVKDHPAWPFMIEHYRETQRKYATSLGGRLMTGSAVDQREIDFWRGYWAGVFAVLTSPEDAERAYVKAEQDALRGRKGNRNV